MHKSLHFILIMDLFIVKDWGFKSILCIKSLILHHNTRIKDHSFSMIHLLYPSIE